MYVYMYVYMYMYAYMYVYMYMCVCMYVCIYIYIYIYIYLCSYIYICVYIYIYSARVLHSRISSRLACAWLTLTFIALDDNLFSSTTSQFAAAQASEEPNVSKKTKAQKGVCVIYVYIYIYIYTCINNVCIYIYI